MLIECSNAKQVLSQAGRVTLDRYMERLKPGEQFFLKFVSRADARSLEQSRFYWSQIIPAMCYYVDWLDFITDIKTEKETAHMVCKLQYCQMERPDLITKLKIRNPKTKKMVTKYMPFSWKLSDMPRKEANAYIDWCKRIIENHSTVDLNTALGSMT